MRFIPTRRTLLHIKDSCTKKRIRQIAFFTIMVALSVTIVISLKTINNPVSILGLGLISLATTPYIYLAIMLKLVSQSAPSIAIAVSSFLVGGFGIMLFAEALFIHPDAYGETIFMVVSVWQWAFLLLVTLPVYFLNKAKNRNPVGSQGL